MTSASEPASKTEASNLGARAVRGTLWTVLRYAVEYVLRLGNNLILTRLLFPEAFGLLALVNAFMAGLQMFSDVGIGASVVQNPRGDQPAFLRTAWTFQVLRGVLLWVMAAACAGLMAGLYQQPQLQILIPIAGLSVLILAFNSISLARLKRHIKLGKIVAIQISGRVVASVVMISWALIAPSVWALVAGSLASAIVKVVLSHTIVERTSVRFGWDKESVSGLLNFGKWIFVSTILAFFAGQADRLIFGRLMPVATLGVYSIALLFARIPTQLVWTIGNLVLFPTFSRSVDSTQPLSVTYKRVRRPIYMLGSLPVMLLGAGGPALIAALYDPRWAEAGSMLQPLALGTWFQILQTVSGAALLAVGDSRRQAIGNGMKFAAMVVFVPVGFIYFGILGGISGLATAEIFRYATLAHGVRRHQLPGPSADLVYTLYVLAGIAAGVAFDQTLLADANPWARLFGVTGGVVLAWAPVAAVVLRDEVKQIPAMIRARRS